MQQAKLYRAAAILGVLIAVVAILVYAKSFLIPLSFGAILSMLLLPVTIWMEQKGVNRILAIVLAILVLVGFFALLIALISWQLSDIAGDSAQLEEQLTKKYEQLQQFIADKLGISPEKQQQLLKKQQGSGAQKLSAILTGALAGLGSFLTNTILVLVYIFLFIYFRSRLKGFLLRVVPRTQKSNALDTITKAQKVAQKYLTGMFLMIVCLWVMYGIGFTIAGVKNPVFFAILCGVLELIPFVGNLTGTAITLGMSLMQGGGTNILVAILITYATVQFLQSYLLEPLVVGAEVSINPLFTIIGLVFFEFIWGIPGMVLAIPIMGILKIVCDHVEVLQPVGYLIGQDKKEEGGFRKKIKAMGKKIAARFK